MITVIFKDRMVFTVVADTFKIKEGIITVYKDKIILACIDFNEVRLIYREDLND